jgi:hypothetical protein
LTGDKVDLVATCEGYDFVRFHGAKRVSAGWAEASRIEATGSAYVPRPPNAAALCKAAEDTLNRSGKLQPIDMSALDPKVVQALNLEVGANAVFPQVAIITVGGRSLAAASIDSGGTCHSFTLTMLNADLTSRLSPADRDDRDIENHGHDSWSFGVDEHLVTVLGEPVMISQYEGSPNFHLSVIDKTGDIIPVCEGGPVPLERRRLASSNNDKVCQAVLHGREVPVALTPPSKEQLRSLRERPDDLKEGDLTYELLGTGRADLGNTGKPRNIGLVTFAYQSTAGCGSGSYSQVVPIYLDDRWRADPSSTLNRVLADSMPNGMADGKVVSLMDKTYVELSPVEGGASSEVWTVDDKGPKQVCSFQLTRFAVKPISADEPQKPAR